MSWSRPGELPFLITYRTVRNNCRLLQSTDCQGVLCSTAVANCYITGLSCICEVLWFWGRWRVHQEGTEDHRTEGESGEAGLVSGRNWNSLWADCQGPVYGLSHSTVLPSAPASSHPESASHMAREGHVSSPGCIITMRSPGKRHPQGSDKAQGPRSQPTSAQIPVCLVGARESSSLLWPSGKKLGYLPRCNELMCVKP